MTHQPICGAIMTSGNHAIMASGPFKLLYRPGTCDEVVLSDAYQQRRFFATGYVPQNNHIILDIGAHIGAFALAAAVKVPDGRVYAIEAAEDNFRYLRTNVELNAAHNISPYHLALTNYQGEAKLYAATENWAYTLADTNTDTDTWRSVRADTLTHFLADNHIERVDYLKCNVEGAEYDIFLATPTDVLQRLKFILIEYHPAERYAVDDLVHHFRQSGFATRIRGEMNGGRKGWLESVQETHR